MKWCYNKSFLNPDVLTEWINDHMDDIEIISIACQSDMFYVFYWRK